MNEEIPPRLLLVDDEATLREPLAEYLSRQGFGVSEADSAAKARTLLRVKVEDLADADDLFTKLMGDVVEPRREFIRANALSVENLDF